MRAPLLCYPTIQTEFGIKKAAMACDTATLIMLSACLLSPFIESRQAQV